MCELHPADFTPYAESEVKTKYVSELDATELVARFMHFSSKSAGSVIEMAKIVVLAQSLPSDEFERFCLGIRFDANSSAIRKLAAIGKKADDLMAHVEKLPGNWTTLYYLSQLPAENLQSAAECGKLRVNMTGEHAKTLVNEAEGKPASSIRNKPYKAAEKPFALTLDFGNSPDRDLVLAIEKSIRDFLSKYNAKCDLLFSQQLEEVVKAVADVSMEGAN